MNSDRAVAVGPDLICNIAEVVIDYFRIEEVAEFRSTNTLTLRCPLIFIPSQINHRRAVDNFLPEVVTSAMLAEPVEQREQIGVVDLPGVRPVALRHARDLDVRHQRLVAHEAFGEILAIWV